jgi:hypothetical protein
MVTHSSLYSEDRNILSPRSRSKTFHVALPCIRRRRQVGFDPFLRAFDQASPFTSTFLDVPVVLAPRVQIAMRVFLDIHFIHFITPPHNSHITTPHPHPHPQLSLPQPPSYIKTTTYTSISHILSTSIHRITCLPNFPLSVYRCSLCCARM